MSESDAASNIHAQFLKDLGTVFACKPEPYNIAAHLINEKGNYQTATALMFGLSWQTHKEWLLSAAAKLKEDWNVAKDGKTTAEWLAEYANYYITEVQTYPEDAT